MYNYPYMRPSLFGRGMGLAKSINWGGLLDGTQKTLGIINQAIPIIYQIKPIMNNAKTMFRIASSIKNSDSDSDSTNANPSTPTTNINNENKPIFYI